MSGVFTSFANAMPTVLLHNGSCQNLLQFDHGARVGLLQLLGAARGLADSHQPAIRRQQADKGSGHPGAFRTDDPRHRNRHPMAEPLDRVAVDVQSRQIRQGRCQRVQPRLDRATIRPARAALYSGTPFTLTAEYIGGTCWRRPTKRFMTSAMATCSGSVSATRPTTVPVASCVSVATPSLNTAR